MLGRQGSTDRSEASLSKDKVLKPQGHPPESKVFLLIINNNSQQLNQSIYFTNFHKTTPQIFTMESIKQGVNYVAESVQSVTSGVSKEANKEVAKDSNVNIGTR